MSQSQQEVHPCRRQNAAPRGEGTIFVSPIAKCDGPLCRFANFPASTCLWHLLGHCPIVNCTFRHDFTSAPDPKGVTALSRQVISPKHPCLIQRCGYDCPGEDSCPFAAFPSGACLVNLIAPGCCPKGDDCCFDHNPFEEAKEMLMTGINRMSLLPPSEAAEEEELHPCLRLNEAKWKCNIGDRCKFALFPRDACLFHLKYGAPCLAGAQICPNPHIDATDERYQNPTSLHPCDPVLCSGEKSATCEFALFPRLMCMDHLVRGKCFQKHCNRRHDIKSSDRRYQNPETTAFKNTLASCLISNTATAAVAAVAPATTATGTTTPPPPPMELPTRSAKAWVPRQSTTSTAGKKQ